MVLGRRAGPGLKAGVRPKLAVREWRLPRRLRLAEQARKRRVQVLKPRPPSDPGRIARASFGMGPKDERALERALFDQARREYGRTVAAEAQMLGYDIANVRVTDRAVLRELRDRARFASHSIRRTYNKDLDKQIVRIRADTPTANRYTYARRLEAWDRQRAAWKDRQIAVTEMGQVTSKARLDFYERNKIGAVARVVPRVAVCPACAGFVGAGEMTIAEARTLPLPLHVGCPHMLQIEYTCQAPARSGGRRG